MTTLSETLAWLKTPGKRIVVLAEIIDLPAIGQTISISSTPYTSTSTDTPANKGYDACIIGGINFNETLPIDGNVSISYGDIEIDNTGGIKDSWLDYPWMNKNINLYIGDVTWTRANFYQIFTGVIAEISSRSLNTLNIIIADKLQKLNNPITEAVLPSIDSTSDILIPVTFGEVFNVTPIPTTGIINTLEYQVHTGPIEDIIEVRDNGVPVQFTKNLAQGKFNLNQTPYGEITCSVQGHKDTVYYNNIADIIKEIVTKYGPIATRFTNSDIDLDNFSSFSTLYPQPVGVYINNRENILNVCNLLAGSIGAKLSISSTGLLRLVRVHLPSTGSILMQDIGSILVETIGSILLDSDVTATYSITGNDIEKRSLSITSKADIRASTKLGYCKNWTIQKSNIAAGVPTQSAILFESEWLYTTITNTEIQTEYKLETEVAEETTLLLSKTDAIAEATRRNEMWSIPRYTFTLKAYPHMLGIELGDIVSVKDPRFDLIEGKVGLVINIARSWLTGRVTLGILV